MMWKIEEMPKHMIENRIKKEYNKHIESSKKLREKKRLQLMLLLGGTLCCMCGFSDIRALQFDHINGGGSKDQKIRNSHNWVCYYLNNPDLAKKTLQVLCANCNWIKRFTNNEHPKSKVKRVE